MKKIILFSLFLSFSFCFSAQAADSSSKEAKSEAMSGTITNNLTKDNNGFVTGNSVSSTEQYREPPKPMLYIRKVKSPLNTVYKKVFTSLDNNGYFVVFEPNIGKNLAHFAKRWGNDYNKNKLESIRSMVFCNGWYANKVSNADPNMMALCPLHITLIHKKGTTSILFVRPGRVAENSPAAEIARELEQDVIRSIEEALVGR